MKNLVSVCCLGYKHAQYLKENITELWESEYRAIEIIVVDDGSGDGSVELLQELAGNSPFPMKIIAQENTGNVARNFNNAWREAQGEYICFISLDDVLCRDAILSKIALMQNNKQLAFVANSKIIGIDSASQPVDAVAPLTLDSIKNPSVDDLINLEYEEFGAFYLQGVLFRKDVVDAVNAFDEDMIGDDIVLRCKVFFYLKNNPQYSFKILDKPACYYRIHGGNVHKNTARQVKIVAEVLERFFPDKKNPEIFYEWVNSVILSSRFEDYIGLFAYNNRLNTLLLNKRIVRMLKSNAVRYNLKTLIGFIYRKEVRTRHIRHILFSSIKWSRRIKA